MAFQDIYLAENLNLKNTNNGISLAGLPNNATSLIDWVKEGISNGTFPVGGSGTFTTLSGDVVSLPTGGTTSIQSNVVSNPKLAQVATNTVKGRVAAGTGNTTDLTTTQLTTLINTFTTTLTGAVPAPATVSGRVLSDNGTWIAVSGGTIDAAPTSGSSNAVSSGGTFTALSGKQPNLVSGTNIKTINGNSLLGSGDLVISGGSTMTKYTATVTGSAGIICKIYGTSGITVAKTNASTITFVIPANGYMENYQLFYPTAENPGSNATHVFTYTTNTITNQGNSTADVPDIKGWFASAVPTDIYHARAVGSASDFVTSLTSVSLGNITMLMTFGTTGLSSGDIILKGNF